MNTKEFIKRSIKIHGNKYDYNLVDYKNSSTKVKIICKEHGIFKQLPNSHYHKKQGCPECGASKKLTTEEFIKRAKVTHGNKYDYSLVEYKNNKTKVKIICKEHGIFEQIPSSHINNKYGCRYCRKNEKLTNEEFIKRSKEIHRYKYDYSLVKYENNSIKVKIICDNHGIFLQSPSGHMNGQGCKKCYIEKRRMNSNDYIKKCIEIHGKTYNYNKTNYINMRTNVIIKCVKHGYFEQNPINHVRGNGCPMCRESKNEKIIRLFLENNNINFVQEKRFNNCKNKKHLPFDFYLPEYELCIEYDGIQHYIPIKEWGGDKRYETQKRHDNIKNEFCKENNIKLLRIKYTDNVIEKLENYFNI